MALTPEERAKMIAEIQAKEAAPKLSNEERSSLIKDIQESELPIIQEQHPSVSLLDRFFIKNTDATPDQAIKYLQKKNPNLKTKIMDDQILIKDTNEKEWRVLDPTGFDLQDLSDIAGLIPEGAAQVAGTALGGTVGLLGGAPGAFFGGAVGSGLAGGAVNTAKQGIRQALWMQDEFDPKEAAISGAISGATAPLFGGMGNKVVSSLKAPLAKTLAEKGILGTAYEHTTRKAAPKVAEFLSGGSVPAKVFKYMTSNPKKIEVIANAPNAPAEDISGFLLNRAQEAKKLLGPEFEKVSNSTAPVYIGDAADKLKSLIVQKRNALRDAPGNTALQNDLNKLNTVYNRVFKEEGPNIIVNGRVVKGPKVDITNTTARTAYSLKKALGDLIEDSKGVDNAIYVAASSAKKDINKSIEKSLGKEYSSILKEYDRLIKHEDNIKKVFEGVDDITQLNKTDVVLNKVGRPKQAAYTDRIKKLSEPLEVKIGPKKTTLPGIDIEEASLAQQTFNLLHEPSYAPSFTARSVGMAVPRLVAGMLGGSAWGVPGMAIGGGLGLIGGSPGAMKQLLRSGRAVEKTISRTTPGGKKAVRGYINSLINSEVNNDR